MNRKYINFDDNDSVSKYFKEVRKSNILTSEEEVKLAKKIKLGDQKAINSLVKANLKFVVSIAKEYQGQGLPLSDLISEGNYGLLKAAKKFDHTRGFRFISYAVWWVKQSILQSLNDNARIIRLPTNVINKLSYLNKEIAKFEYINEREPIYGEILDKDSVPMEMDIFSKTISLNEIINEDGDELIDLINPNIPDDNKLIVDERVKTEINKAFSALSEREIEIIQCYFGIDTGSEPMTLEAIGERYSLTKERIRQIKNKALRKLRENSKDLYLLLNK